MVLLFKVNLTGLAILRKPQTPANSIQLPLLSGKSMQAKIYSDIRSLLMIIHVHDITMISWYSNIIMQCSPQGILYSTVHSCTCYKPSGDQASDSSDSGYIAGSSGQSSSDPDKRHQLKNRKKTPLKGRKRGCRSPSTTPSTSPASSPTTEYPLSMAIPVAGEGSIGMAAVNCQMMVAQMDRRVHPDQEETSSDSDGPRLQYSRPVPETPRIFVDLVSIFHFYIQGCMHQSIYNILPISPICFIAMHYNSFLVSTWSISLLYRSICNRNWWPCWKSPWQTLSTPSPWWSLGSPSYFTSSTHRLSLWPHPFHAGNCL